MTDLLEAVEKKKPGPPAKPKVEYEDFAKLVQKLSALEKVIAHMAHQSGIPNSLFIENGLKHYELTRKDTRKYG